MRGEVYLILSCYEDREKPIILPEPITDEDGNVYISEDEGSNGEEGEEQEDSIQGNSEGEQIIRSVGILNTTSPDMFLSSTSYLELAKIIFAVYSISSYQ